MFAASREHHGIDLMFAHDMFAGGTMIAAYSSEKKCTSCKPSRGLFARELYACLPACLVACLPAFLTACLLAYRPTFLPIFLPTYLPTYQAF
ncbi:hypothetical protein DPMN_130372 [Dreissena polymorpha]|uniref:Uncharacterized protein n=1 Tax=Dreissena polymorpha TaxID=45954 RepID=A0A9D4H4H1_DREPO|nr:hypothetical protein DPMN_130372 [Dreissena polymorpha]